MKYTKKINLENFEAWSGGKDTLTRLIAHNKCDIVEDYINEVMPDATETDINDFLWFEDCFICSELINMDIDDFYN